MSAGQVIVLISLMAHVYGADPVAFDCMVYGESSYNPAAVNGPHYGLGQFLDDEEPGLSTWDWMAEMALEDPLFLHGYLLANGPTDPVAALSLMAWALKNGYGEHWQTYEMCVRRVDNGD
jgi:hypothetical protein